MTDDQFSEWLCCIRAAESWLQDAFELMEGIEGYSSTGENAHVAALSAIRAVRAVETAARTGV